MSMVTIAVAVTLLAQPVDLKRTTATWVDAHRPAILGELLELLGIPNIAADKPNIRRNAEHLRDLLARHGFAPEILDTTGNPLVFGTLASPGATRTVLFYCHYYGQPVDPSKWGHPDPFTPVVRGDGAA